ncbi:Hypothetical predicted protein [Mytilus galloprovincialis]|uniref:Uncharacterized protein n=1 Tax=Mytilus galloprovincialis TaxID=29158 RepID=A0A8B6ED19_MYTGA|nr:Hypothetical predicted protein [Mytilus galloprovincialis]
MSLPSGAQRIPDLWTFKKRVGPCSHIAIYRPLLNIYHHYLVKEVNINSIVLIHNVEGQSKSKTSSEFNHMQEDEIEIKTEKPYLSRIESEYLDFKSGVYLIERRGYPITTNTKEKVIERTTTRLVEQDITFSSSNSEWFVIWALTGVVECEQMGTGVGNLCTASGGVGGALSSMFILSMLVESSGE